MKWPELSQRTIVVLVVVVAVVIIAAFAFGRDFGGFYQFVGNLLGGG